MKAFVHNLNNFIIKNSVKAKSRFLKNKKLVMTLLVRDEIDIIKANIDFHLDHGVDYIIATDNGSIDGTDKVLKEYQRKGVLHYIEEKEQNYSQSLWVNRMGLIAFKEHQADLIFHCDADEFWWPESGSLKNELTCRSRVDVLGVSVRNMIFTGDKERDSFSDNFGFAVTNPIPSNNHPVDSLEKSLYLFPGPGKVIYRTDMGYLNVIQGNHGIDEKHSGYNQKVSLDIQIIHYPIRSYNHFKNKVINGGSAYEKNPSKAGGWHWRRWYEAYKKDELMDAFAILALDEDETRKYLQSGVISDWSERHKKICSYF